MLVTEQTKGFTQAWASFLQLFTTCLVESQEARTAISKADTDSWPHLALKADNCGSMSALVRACLTTSLSSWLPLASRAYASGTRTRVVAVNCSFNCKHATVACPNGSSVWRVSPLGQGVGDGYRSSGT